MSAIEQPALRSGRITFWWSPVSTSADSAMKCTPQNTMYSASVLLLGEHRQAVAVAAGVGPADHLVALVVVAEDEHAVAERRLGGLDAGGELGLGCAGVALVEGGLEPQHVVGVLHVGFRLLDGGDSPVASPAGMSSPELDMSPDTGPARSA